MRLPYFCRAYVVAIDIKLIVTDAAPLITLAAAQSLDYLLYPELPVLIPDAVFHQSTAAAGKLGAQEIIDWYRAHMDVVRIESTGQLNLQLLQRRFPASLLIEPVKQLQRKRSALIAHVVGQRQEIEVVSCCVALEDQHALDA